MRGCKRGALSSQKRLRRAASRCYRLPGAVPSAFPQQRQRRGPAGGGRIQPGRPRLSKPDGTPEARLCLRVHHPCFSSALCGGHCAEWQRRCSPSAQLALVGRCGRLFATLLGGGSCCPPKTQSRGELCLALGALLLTLCGPWRPGRTFLFSETWVLRKVHPPTAELRRAGCASVDKLPRYLERIECFAVHAVLNYHCHHPYVLA